MRSMKPVSVAKRTEGSALKRAEDQPGRRTAVVAIGGNSLLRPGEDWSVAVEREHVVETCRAIAAMVAAGWRVVVTHGNGPQVGAALLRSERGEPDAYPLPLDLCVASTQAEIGFLLACALDEALADLRSATRSATVLTRVAVNPEDPALARPSKPIGPHLDASLLERGRTAGWALTEEPPHGHRRLVPSPEPLEIIDIEAIQALLEAGRVVIALGGGGIPVVREGRRLRGIEAVVDKDLASALLATELGAELLAVLTDVDAIELWRGRPEARPLGTVTPDALRQHTAEGHFPEGSMGPKVEALLRFIDGGGQHAFVTSPRCLGRALEGEAGTHLRRG